MITRDEVKRVLRLLRRNEDLFIDAALDPLGVIDETAYDAKVVETLMDARLLSRPAPDEPVRIARELSSLMERILRDPRRLTIDADVGGFLVSIATNVNRYKEAVRALSNEDIGHYLGQIERLVDDLRTHLLDSSSQLWHKISSDFGYVSELGLKIKENQAVIEQAKRLNTSLALIRPSEMEEYAGHDPKLKRYLLKWLLDSVEACRQETNDAIHKLNEMLFELKREQSISRLIDSFYRKYQKDPGYTPSDYVGGSDIPEILNQVQPMALTGHAVLDDPAYEHVLAGLVDGLRKLRLDPEEPKDTPHVVVTQDTPPIEPPSEPLSEAVEEYFMGVIDGEGYLSALAHRPPEDVESDPEIWLYAVISRFNSMEDEERRLFKMTYEQSEDSEFSGRHIVSDVSVSLIDDSQQATPESVQRHAAS